MNRNKTFMLSLVAAALGAGCTTAIGPDTQRGAAIGAGTGAVVGGVAGGVRGAAVGAAAGGVAGAAIGSHRDRGRWTEADARTTHTVQQPPVAPASNPPPAAEQPPRPSSDAVWIEGYWDFDPETGQYEWVPAHWSIPPTGYTTWVPPNWERTGEGYTYVRGHWR
jgi:hypothetical protein